MHGPSTEPLGHTSECLRPLGIDMGKSARQASASSHTWGGLQAAGFCWGLVLT